VSGAKCLRTLEDENGRLKPMLGNGILANAGLKDQIPKMATPAPKREAAAHLQAMLDVSERRACSAIAVDRSVNHYQAPQDNVTDLRGKLRHLVH
jgi:hypothetical protein